MVQNPKSKIEWLPEARGALEELLALEAAEGKSAARARLELLRQGYLGLREAGEDRPLAEVAAESRTDRQIARTRGVWVLWMVRARLGVLDFRELQQAWEQGAAGTTTALREWLLARDGVAGGRTSAWPAFFDFWVYGTGLPAYEVQSAMGRPAEQGFAVTLKIANRGAGGISAPAVIRTEEGARHTIPVTVPGGETIEAGYFVLTRPVEAAIDPDGELLQPERRKVWQPVRVRRWRFF
jgi:hypothetical protein